MLWVVYLMCRIITKILLPRTSISGLPDGTSQNYVRTHAMTAAAGSKYMASYDYYDGLGASLPEGTKGITPTGSNLISLQEYDGAGRRSESWLPNCFLLCLYVSFGYQKCGSGQLFK